MKTPTLNAANEVIDGMRFTLDGVPGVIRVESGYCRTDYVHHASAAGKRTQRYRETRRKLGDDYTTTVTECEEVMAKIFERATRLLTK